MALTDDDKKVCEYVLRGNWTWGPECGRASFAFLYVNVADGGTVTIGLDRAPLDLFRWNSGHLLADVTAASTVLAELAEELPSAGLVMRGPFAGPRGTNAVLEAHARREEEKRRDAERSARARDAYSGNCLTEILDLASTGTAVRRSSWPEGKSVSFVMVNDKPEVVAINPDGTQSDVLTLTAEDVIAVDWTAVVK